MDLKKIILISGLLLSQINLFAQEQLRFEDFFQETITLMDKVLTDKAFNSSFKIAPIQEIQIRTETDELDFNRQEYLVRIRPTSSKVMNAQNKYYQIFMEQKNFERLKLKKDFVEAAYFDWLDLYTATKELAKQKELLILLKDEEKVINRIAQVPGNSVKDLIDIQKDVYDLKLEIHKIEKFLEQSLPLGLEVDTLAMVSISSIARKIESGESSMLPVNEQLENALDLQLLDAETAIEIAEQQRVLDYIQVKYGGPHDDQFREKVSVGVGIQLPFSSANRLKMEEITMEKELMENEFQVQARLYEIEVNKQKKEIELLIDELNYAKQLFKGIKFRSQELVNRAAKQEGTNPLPMIKNKKDLIKYDLDMLKLEEAIYKEYIDLLILTGKLFEEPFQNYLTKS